MTDAAAEQRTLAAEHAAVYVFGVLGGLAATMAVPALRTALSTAYDVHRTRRDDLERVLRAAGQAPVAASPAYDVPRGLSTATLIAAQALRLERSCTTTYAALVAASTGALRRWAITTLADSAVSELAFGGRPRALPGVGASY